ncbi:MAG: fused MFS/spermidine synthase [bacterium]
MTKKKNTKKQQPAAKPQAPAPKTPSGHIFLQVFVSGMAVMALELSASRLYAPYFGSSVFVWAGLIGALLLFLAIGYHIGGNMSRAGAGPDRLFMLTLAGSVYAGASPYIAMPVMSYMADRAGFFGNMLPGVLLTTLVALAAPLILFGCALPLATGILSRGERDAGSVAGMLYALSTAGSIIGVFLPVLVTLPTIGTRLTFLVFSAAPALVAAAGLARVKWLLALIVFIPYGIMAHAIPIKGFAPGEKMIAERETEYNYARIVKQNGMRQMTIDQGWLTYSNIIPGRLKTDSYRDYFPLAKLLSGDPDYPKNVCILGAAGGTDARILKHTFPQTKITGVEIDPGLIELGNKYMELKAATDRIVISDGRAFLRADREKYDLIVVDVYNQSYIPFHMATVEFFLLVRERLTERGVVAFNVAWRTGDDMRLVHRCANTLSRVFPSVYIRQMAPKTNIILFATVKKTPLEKMNSVYNAVDNEYIREIADENPIPLQIYSTNNKTNEVFTDDLAPVEQLTDDTIKEIAEYIRSSGS